MGFALRSEDIDLPLGASAASTRMLVMWNDRPVFGLTQGAFRTYLFPVYSPAGFALTSESPSDHPHHHSIWVGADHVNLHVPAEHRTEVYSYNFYVNDVFQGRAPGRIVQTQCQAQEQGDTMRITQHLAWRGPREWGAPDGRHVLDEQRLISVRHLPAFNAFQWHITSSLTAPNWAVSIGPTRHAWFNARIGPGMATIHGGSHRCAPHPAPMGQLAWHVCTGSVGGGHTGGVAMAMWPANTTHDWYVSPWGVMTANPCLHQALSVEPGAKPVSLSARFLVFDGPLTDEHIQAALQDSPASSP